MVEGFMCKTDWDDEIGHASDGNKVYPSEKALRAERPCVETCGIVKVRVSLVEVIQEDNMTAMWSASSAADR